MKTENKLTRTLLDKIFQLRPSYYCCPFCGRKIYVDNYFTVGELLNNQQLNLECCNCRYRGFSVGLFYFGLNYADKYVITPRYVLPDMLIMHQCAIDYTRSFITYDYMQVSLYLDFPNENTYSTIKDYHLTIGWNEENALELQRISNLDIPTSKFDESVITKLETQMELLNSLDDTNRRLEEEINKKAAPKQIRRRIIQKKKA